MTLHSIISIIVGALFCLGAAMGFRDTVLSLRTGILHLPQYIKRRAEFAFSRQHQTRPFWIGVVTLLVISLIWAVVGSTLVVTAVMSGVTG